ncbi:MAG: hypothetical protein ACFCD0_16135 [Gemmataceae bacterium]
MAATIHPCPNCRQPLSVAQALPARVKCPRCQQIGTIHGTGVATGPPVSRPPSPPPTPLPPTAATAVTTTPQSSSGARSTPGQLRAPAAANLTRLKRLIIGGLAFAGLVVFGALFYAFFGPGGKDGETFADVPELYAEGTEPIELALLPYISEKAPPPVVKKKTLPPEVRKALDKGVAFLQRELLLRCRSDEYLRQGSRNQEAIGAAALAGMTLIESGLPPTDRAVQVSIDWVLKGTPKQLRAYPASLCVLFLDRLIENPYTTESQKRTYRQALRTLGFRMLASQGPKGGWSYDLVNVNEQQLQQMARQIPRTQGDHQWLNYRLRRWDNSIAQFVVLALWVARRHQVPVAGALLREEQRYRQYQHEGGGWAYQKVGRSPAMTCSGLIGLAVSHGVRDLAPKKKKTPVVKVSKDADIQKALKYLAPYLDHLKRVPDGKGGTKVARPDGHVQNYYFLWSLERMAVIYSMDKLRGRDWYNLGKAWVLTQQREDGSWRQKHGVVVNTCFAMLFLLKANVAEDLTDKLLLISGLGAENSVGRPELPWLPPHRRPRNL